MLTSSTHFHRTPLPLALNTSTLLSVLLTLSAKSQAQTVLSARPFQQPEQYEWTIARETIVPLTGDRLLATLAEAESLQTSVNNASFEQSVQFVVIPDAENLFQLPTADQAQTIEIALSRKPVCR